MQSDGKRTMVAKNTQVNNAATDEQQSVRPRTISRKATVVLVSIFATLLLAALWLGPQYLVGGFAVNSFIVAESYGHRKGFARSKDEALKSQSLLNQIITRPIFYITAIFVIVLAVLFSIRPSYIFWGFFIYPVAIYGYLNGFKAGIHKFPPGSFYHVPSEPKGQRDILALALLIVSIFGLFLIIAESARKSRQEQLGFMDSAGSAYLIYAFIIVSLSIFSIIRIRRSGEECYGIRYAVMAICIVFSPVVAVAVSTLIGLLASVSS